MQLPELSPRLEAKPDPVPTERLIFPVARGTVKVGKKLGRLFAKSIGHVNETELNEKVIRGLRQQLNQENTDSAIDQAFQIFYQRMGPEANRPELYELYENDDLDKALALFGKRWVIGRPKRK